ncbi:MAG: 50S ribosomal protein L32 [Actinobacteria bacterium]|nr:50S ribosomal protein L32 [Actinomycetota bacterium]
MAVPKRKKSRSRTRHRRARWLAAPRPTMANCSRCASPIKPHTVCSVCGYYRGRRVLEVDV